MTGEITLHGYAKRIGGVYEKVTGGIRDGIKEFILPEENANNFGRLHYGRLLRIRHGRQQGLHELRWIRLLGA